MQLLRSFRAKYYGEAPFWQKAVAGFLAGSLTGGALEYALAPNPLIPFIACGVSAGMYYTFGKRAEK